MIHAPILPGISIRLIQCLTAAHFKIPVEKMTAADRRREYAWPRQIAMALVCEFLPRKGWSTTGHYFGGRDHTTVMHAKDAVIERAADPADKTRFHLEALRTQIEAHRPPEVQLELELAACR